MKPITASWAAAHLIPACLVCHAVAAAVPDSQESHEHHGAAAATLNGVFGGYSMTREGSGTSWQPDSSRSAMLHVAAGPWSLMPLVTIQAAYSHAESRQRGDNEAWVGSMGMLMGHRSVGAGTLGFRAMLSLDPYFIGKDGYPLLFQTGETADGAHPLVDRQHPHDLFMELAASYSHPLGRGGSAFVYLGLPGEPALGPVTFMHRASGLENPDAPLSHHWLDSTHITFGVATAGLIVGDMKFEASAFNGHEPDEDRYDIETRALDSWSVRATWNPTPDLSGQVSYGRLGEPEQLEPGIDVDRLTASVTWNRVLAAGAWQTTLAVGHNDPEPGRGTWAWLVESAASPVARLTVFSRTEHVQKAELFEHDGPFGDRAFAITKLTAGAVYDVLRSSSGRLGVGASYSLHFIPDDLEPYYDGRPESWTVFLRWTTG